MRSPTPGQRLAVALLPLFGAAFLGVAHARAATPADPGSQQRSGRAPTVLRVMLDPGHGGDGQEPTGSGGDDWDSQYGRFLRVLNFGGSVRLGPGRTLAEHELALELARKLRALLELTQTEAGWKRFEAMLLRMGARAPLQRVRFETRLTRDDDYRARIARKEPDPNRDFRLLDSPSVLPARDGVPMHPGRMSQVVEWGPDLLLVMHLNDIDSRSQRGMNALFVPSPEEFEALRQAAVSNAPFTPQLQRLAACWVARGRFRSERESMLEGMWKHFTGFTPSSGGRAPDLSRPEGKIWNHLTWAYRDASPGRPILTLTAPRVGPFWEREASPMEQRRRGGGPEGFGGDNLYAGQELLRFMRLSLARDVAASPPPVDLFGKGLQATATLIGPHDRPLCAPWTLPLYVNSVTAYLEMGYLSNARDRWMLLNRGDRYIEGLAAGVYSLAAGLALQKVPGLAAPLGAPLAFEAYRPHVARAKWRRVSPPIVEHLGELTHPAERPEHKGRRSRL